MQIQKRCIKHSGIWEKEGEVENTSDQLKAEEKQDGIDKGYILISRDSV